MPAVTLWNSSGRGKRHVSFKRGIPTLNLADNDIDKLMGSIATLESGGPSNSAVAFQSFWSESSNSNDLRKKFVTESDPFF
jgi:hypothetical protein